MSVIGTVFVKEFLDNLRDRRTLLTALVVAPLLGPLLIYWMTSLNVRRLGQEPTGPRVLLVSGADEAPGLVEHLRELGAEVRLVSSDAAALAAEVRGDQVQAGLVIAPGFAAALAAGEPARVELVAEETRDNSRRLGAWVRSALTSWERRLAEGRLVVAGLDPGLARPLAVQTTDLSSPYARAFVLAAMVPYFILFSVLVGGFYLAIDTTAGERERGSLEPLLSTGATRRELLVGKLLATWSYSLIALVLCLATLAVGIAWSPLALLGMALDTRPWTLTKIGLLTVPFALFGSALLTVVASFTRSFKEAQTYLSIVLMLPFVPMIFAVMVPSEPSAVALAIPNLGQHLLIGQLLQGKAVGLGAVGLSVVGTLLAAAALGALAVRLYERETVLG